MLRALIVALSVAACTSPAPETLGGAALNGTDWRAREFDIPAGVSAPTLRFENGRASGSTGCNRWSANVDADGRGDLRFNDISFTERACGDLAMDVERRFIERLAMTRAADIDAESRTLRLIGPEADHLMSFDSAQP